MDYLTFVFLAFSFFLNIFLAFSILKQFNFLYSQGAINSKKNIHKVQLLDVKKTLVGVYL
jgi:hypothetical protein